MFLTKLEENGADEATVVLLRKLSGSSDIEKAKAAIGQALSVEEQFNHDFAWVDFTGR